MAIIERKAGSKIEVDLIGPNGNAFVLLGMAKGWAKQLKKDWTPIMSEAISGDYDNLLAVLDREFGDYVDFIK